MLMDRVSNSTHLKISVRAVVRQHAQGLPRYTRCAECVDISQTLLVHQEGSPFVSLLTITSLTALSLLKGEVVVIRERSHQPDTDRPPSTSSVSKSAASCGNESLRKERAGHKKHGGRNPRFVTRYFCRPQRLIQTQNHETRQTEESSGGGGAQGALCKTCPS